MPRMRMVKPEFWTDSKVVRVSRDARLLFIGLWNFADCDAGHVEADPFGLKMKIFPADNIDVEELLVELVEIGLVERHQSTAGEFLLVPGLRSHQKTDSRWTPRCRVCKADKEGSLELTETHASSGEFTETHRNSSNLALVGEGKGGVRKGEVGKGEVSIYRSNPDGFDRFWDAYPRKVGKPKAKNAFAQASKTTDPETIIEGAEAYRDDPNRQKEFTAHPTTWLNREGWNDDPLPERTSSAPRSFAQQESDSTMTMLQEFASQPWALGAGDGN